MLTQASPEIDFLYPLSLFRQEEGLPLPEIERIEGEAVPEPYQRLLVHQGDMTSRLEAFHGGHILLGLLHREKTPSAYRREVLLHVQPSGIAVEYGAIEIVLEAFEPDLRALILEERLPLGGLLNQHGIQYRSEPRGFFRLGPDPGMNAIFNLPGEHIFYGRSNELHASDGRLLARIIEVLRP